jgi:DNA repair protein RecN (Recombination protein N)
MSLQRLQIENFGLIAHASVEFAHGLTAFTGETGSGKTMLLGALAFVLGERTAADMVRAGASRARVTLDVDAPAGLLERFAHEGFDIEADESATFARELQAGGKSTARINGRPATAAQLRAFGESLVDAIGQHEQQRLLGQAYQLDLLDRFAGSDAWAAREKTAAAHARLSALEREAAALRESDARGSADVEFARFALADIDALALQPGEDDALRERRDYLGNAERIRAALAQAHDALTAEGGALESFGSAAAALGSIVRFGGEIAAAADTLSALQSEAGDAAAAIARLAEASEFDPGEAERVGQRLDAIERARKKYGRTADEFAASRARFAEVVERYDTRDDRLAGLDAAIAAERTELDAAADSLGVVRVRAAAELEARVAAELRALAMPAARFVVRVDIGEVGPLGRERVEFALSANPGEPPRALAKAASGGELSRVLLSLVVALAERREPSALVFDEIDAGVGGATANAVGERLGVLARSDQVVCVTHLAQIAAWADRQYALRKRDAGGITTIEVVELRDESAVVEEVARMLSGSAAGVARDHAATLVHDARARKTRATRSTRKAARA